MVLSLIILVLSHFCKQLAVTIALILSKTESDTFMCDKLNFFPNAYLKNRDQMFNVGMIGYESSLVEAICSYVYGKITTA